MNLDLANENRGTPHVPLRICDREYFPHRTRFDDARIIGLRSMQISADDTVGFEGLHIESEQSDTDVARNRIHGQSPVSIIDPLLLAEAEDSLGCLSATQRALSGKTPFMLQRLQRTYRGSAGEQPSRAYALDDLPKDVRALRDLAYILRPHLGNTSTIPPPAHDESTHATWMHLTLRNVPIILAGSPVGVEDFVDKHCTTSIHQGVADAPSQDFGPSLLEMGETKWDTIDKAVRVVLATPPAHLDAAYRIHFQSIVDVPFWKSRDFPNGPFDVHRFYQQSRDATQRLVEGIGSAHLEFVVGTETAFDDTDDVDRNENNVMPMNGIVDENNVMPMNGIVDEKCDDDDDGIWMILRGRVVEKHVKIERVTSSDNQSGHAMWLHYAFAVSMGGLCAVVNLSTITSWPPAPLEPSSCTWNAQYHAFHGRLDNATMMECDANVLYHSQQQEMREDALTPCCMRIRVRPH